MAAGARIDRLGAAHGALAQSPQRRIDLLARAGAGICVAGLLERIQRLLISRAPRGLAQHRAVVSEAQRLQLPQDFGLCAGLGAGAIDVFNPQQPAAVVGTRIKPAAECSHHGASVQGAAGRGCKAAGVGAHRRRCASVVQAWCGPLQSMLARGPMWRSISALRVVGLANCSSHHASASPWGAFLGCGAAAVRHA